MLSCEVACLLLIGVYVSEKPLDHGCASARVSVGASASAMARAHVDAKNYQMLVLRSSSLPPLCGSGKAVGASPACLRLTTC